MSLFNPSLWHTFGEELKNFLQRAAYQAFAAAGVRPPPPISGFELDEMASVVPNSFFIPAIR
jgi:hypothetical protein